MDPKNVGLAGGPPSVGTNGHGPTDDEPNSWLLSDIAKSGCFRFVRSDNTSLRITGHVKVRHRPAIGIRGREASLLGAPEAAREWGHVPFRQMT